jgi:hypothetical protein
MGWDNPPLPWREFEKLLSWRRNGDQSAAAPASRPEADEEPGETLEEARARPAGPAWAELHCHSSYSFLALAVRRYAACTWSSVRSGRGSSPSARNGSAANGGLSTCGIAVEAVAGTIASRNVLPSRR